MSALRMTPTMLHSIDTEGRIEEVSDEWLKKLGYERDDVIGRPSTDFLSKESARYAREVVLPAFFATGVCDVEYDMCRKDGTLFPVRLRGAAMRGERGEFLRSIAVLEDLTEQRALEQKMLAAQKLESLGFMAGNIAHDFNNLLASVVGNVQLAQRHAAQVPAAVGALDQVLVASMRAADLCRQLLAYSGRGRFQIEQVVLDDLVAEMVKVLEVNVGDKATIELRLAGTGVEVEADATQLRQIVMNLVINAGEALAGDPRTIVITTSQRELTADEIAVTLHPDVAPGRFVSLEVADTGIGMTKEVVARIFDPFFSTKTTGRGLGLAAVLGIVRGHHGTVQVHSEVGVGTRFQIFLPIAVRRDARLKTPAAIRRGGKVAVIDDDDLLRGTLMRQLAHAGYEVVEASTADEGLALARMQDIATFLIDVTMPGTTGPELAKQLRAHAPHAAIVLMSGYSTVDVPAYALDDVRFLQKPFSQEELLRVIEAG